MAHVKDFDVTASDRENLLKKQNVHLVRARHGWLVADMRGERGRYKGSGDIWRERPESISRPIKRRDDALEQAMMLVGDNVGE